MNKTKLPGQSVADKATSVRNCPAPLYLGSHQWVEWDNGTQKWVSKDYLK